MKFSTLIEVIVLVEILNNFAEGSACNTCSSSQVLLFPGDNHETVTPRATVPTTGTDGCLRMTVSCDVRGIPNANTYMMFQNEIGGPLNPTNLITADFVCTNGAWVFTDGGFSLEITEVKCILGGVRQDCGTCTPCDIVFSPKQGPGTIGATWKDYIIDSDGCLSLTAICSNPNGTSTFMQFNGDIGGPASATDEEITATVRCNDGAWHYTQSGYDTVISEVNCIAA